MGVLTRCDCARPDPPVGDYCRACQKLIDKSAAVHATIDAEELRRRAHLRDLRKVKRNLLDQVAVVDELIKQAAS
jgi:hypothetical protein